MQAGGRVLASRVTSLPCMLCSRAAADWTLFPHPRLLIPVPKNPTSRPGLPSQLLPSNPVWLLPGSPAGPWTLGTANCAVRTRLLTSPGPRLPESPTPASAPAGHHLGFCQNEDLLRNMWGSGEDKKEGCLLEKLPWISSNMGALNQAWGQAKSALLCASHSIVLHPVGSAATLWATWGQGQNLCITATYTHTHT